MSTKENAHGWENADPESYRKFCCKDLSSWISCPSALLQLYKYVLYLPSELNCPTVKQHVILTFHTQMWSSVYELGHL